MKKWFAIGMIAAVVGLGTGCDTEKAQDSAGLYAVYSMDGDIMKMGYIDDEGNAKIPLEYDYAVDYQENGLAIVAKDNKHGVINKEGKCVVELKYGSIGYYSEGFALGTDDFLNFDVLDEKGKVVFSAKGLEGSFKEGLIAFQNEAAQMGYVDTTGKVVIEPQYQEAKPFDGGKALVKADENKYLLIDKAGEVLETYSYERVYSLGEGLYGHEIMTNDGEYFHGIMDEKGAILLEAEFYAILPYQKGGAVVEKRNEDGEATYGVVDTKGEWVVPLEYDCILPLDNGYYSVRKKTELDAYQTNAYMKTALMDPKGKLLTDESYYMLNGAGEDLFSVCDETDTFLLDANGKEIKKGIRIPGIGILEKQGNAYKAEIDSETYYYKEDGKVIWTPEKKKDFGDITVKTMAVRKNRFEWTKYPVVGCKDKTLEADINKTIESIFLPGSAAVEQDPGYPSEINKWYSANRLGDVLIIENIGYEYSAGAAHGNGWNYTEYIDLKTGSRYNLQDLFKKDSGFSEKLAALIKEKIPGSDYDGVIDIDEIGPIESDQNFNATPKGIDIYYQSYEIAAYAAGNPTFSITWEEVDDLLNKEGLFWQHIQADIKK